MLKRSLCGVTLLLAAHASQADVITQTISVAEQSTNISEVLSFDLFDTVGGTRVLESVSFSIEGLVNGMSQVENLNANDTNINAAMSAVVSISSMISGELISLEMSAMETMLVSAFDGTIDYEGTSGSTFLNLNADEYGEVFFTDSASLAAYTGSGTSTLDFMVNATSVISGGGNLVSRFMTTAAGNINVIYTFRDDLSTIVTNEPAYIALIGLGILGFASYKRRAA